MPASAEVQAATLENFIEGWRQVTPESWTSLWSDNCTQQFLPFALGIPAQNKAEVLTTVPKLLEVLQNWKLEIHETVLDAPNSKAVIYAKSFADTPFGDFKWTNEYAIFVTFTEDGEKIEKIEEMVDTAFYQQFYPKFQKYMLEQAAQ